MRSSKVTLKAPYIGAGTSLWDRPSVPMTSTHAQDRFGARIGINKHENASKSFTMFHVYETLTSDVTSDFSGNVASKFKVKPGLNLPGLRWKVSIHSAVLPKMALLKDLQTSSTNLITFYGKTEKRGATDEWTKAEFNGSDLPALEKSEMSATAEDFFNCVMHKLNESAHGNLTSGFKFSKDWTALAWDKTGAQPELILSSDDATNILVVNKTFGKQMGWIKTDASGKISLGANMVPDYMTYAKGTSLSNGKAITKSNATHVKLNALSDWCFINLEQSFKEALNLHARPLIVSAKVTSGSVTVTQPLGRVYYAPQGRERYLYTPPMEEVHHLIKTKWDEVEIKITELDGTQVQFQDDSQCVLRLHFTLDE